MEIEEIKKLARNLMFEVTDEEARDIAKDFDTLEEQLAFFDQINTDGVEEMIYPFDTPTSFYREDEVDNVLSQDDLLKNAGKVISGHVVVPKVVK